jgi:hypothetical protein
VSPVQARSLRSRRFRQSWCKISRVVALGSARIAQPGVSRKQGKSDQMAIAGLVIQNDIGMDLQIFTYPRQVMHNRDIELISCILIANAGQ